MKRFYSVLFALSMFALTNVAFAQPLDQAKGSGLVGEQLNGYLGLVDSAAPPAIHALVNEVNAKRKAEYEQIAKKNGTTVQAVEALAAQKAIAQTPKGQFVQQPSGWVKK